MHRKQKSNRKLLQVSVYGGDPQIDAEHDYSLHPMSQWRREFTTVSVVKYEQMQHSLNLKKKKCNL